MKGIIQRFPALFISVTIILTFIAGCNRPEFNDELPEYAYVIKEAVPVPGDKGEVTAIAYTDGKVFFATADYEYDKETFLTSVNCDLYSMNIDGTSLARLPNYEPTADKPGDTGGGVYIDSLVIDNDGNIWIAEMTVIYTYNLPAGFDMKNDSVQDYYVSLEQSADLRKLDQTGTEQLFVDLDIYRHPEQYVNDFFDDFEIDSSGNIYLQIYDGYERLNYYTCVLDSAGNKLFELDYGGIGWIQRFVRMSDGSVGYHGYVSQDGSLFQYAVIKIDFDKQRCESAVTYHSGGDYTYSGSGGFDILFECEDRLYGYTLGNDKSIDYRTTSAELLLTWLDSSIIGSNIYSIDIISDEQIVSIGKCGVTDNGNPVFEILLLEKVPYSQLSEKTVISFVTLWPLHSSTRDAVITFNRNNPDYIIQVTDYSQFNYIDNPNGGLEVLTAEIVSGNVPDIFEVTSLPYNDYVSAGMFADLYPMIDADPDIGREDFILGILDAAEIDGRLYQIFPSFGVSTLAGHPSIVGSDMGWNSEEFKAVLDENPNADIALGQWFTGEQFLQASIAFDIDKYIDTSAGTASFDTPEFIRLLEFAETLPDRAELWNLDEDSGDNRLHNSEVFLTNRQIAAPVSLRNYTDYMYYKKVFGGEVTFKGYPCRDRDGHSLLVGSGVAISESSEYKDVVWSFVRTFLDEAWLDMNQISGFPANRAAYDKMADTILADDSVYNIFGIEADPLIPADVDVITKLISSASIAADSVSWGLDQLIWDIIREEASDFFNGACSAGDAANAIQSRVSMYIAERV